VGSRTGEDAAVGTDSACDINRTRNLRLSVRQPSANYASSEVRTGVPEPLPSGLYKATGHLSAYRHRQHTSAVGRLLVAYSVLLQLRFAMAWKAKQIKIYSQQ